MKKLLSISLLSCLMGCAQSPQIDLSAHPLEGRIFKDIDPNLPSQELIMTSFQSPTLKLRDIHIIKKEKKQEWEVLFQTSDYSQVFSLKVVAQNQKLSQLTLLNTTQFIVDSVENMNDTIELKPENTDDIEMTLKMLKNLRKVSFDPNNIGNLSELIRLFGEK